MLKRENGPSCRHREQGGLTYMLDIHSFSSLDAGYFGVVLECAAEKIDTALPKLDESLHQLLQDAKDENNYASLASNIL